MSTLACSLIALMISLAYTWLWDGIDLSYTSEHAWSSSAYLQVVLSNSGPVEHSIETGDFVHLHGNHLKNLGHFVHGGQGEEVVVLFLSHHEEGDAGGVLVVGRVLSQDLPNLLIVLWSELKWSLVSVVLSISVVHKSTK